MVGDVVMRGQCFKLFRYRPDVGKFKLTLIS